MSYIIIQCTIGATTGGFMTTVQRRELMFSARGEYIRAFTGDFTNSVNICGSPLKATAIQATGMRFTSRGFAWNERVPRPHAKILTICEIDSTSVRMRGRKNTFIEVCRLVDKRGLI